MAVQPWRQGTQNPRCYNTNRFRRGQLAGCRMTAIDGGTGETGTTAQLVVHLNDVGKIIDIPMPCRRCRAVARARIIAFAIVLLVKEANRTKSPPTATPTKTCSFCLTETVPVKATRCAGCCGDLPATGR